MEKGILIYYGAGRRAIRMTSVRALLLALVLAASTALAGCFGGDDEDGGDGSGTTPGGNTSTGGGTGGTGSGGSSGGGTGGNTTTPPPPPPPDVNETYSISVAPPTPPATSGSGEAAFTVPATGWRSFTVTAAIQPLNPSAPFLTGGVTVSVRDPSDAEVGAATFQPGPVQGAQTITVSASTAGEYRIVASGTGAQITVSGNIMIDY